jgi:hypothetical protein
LAHAIAGQAERIGRLGELDQAVRRATSAVHAACSVVDEAVEQEAQKARMHGRAPDPSAVTDDAERHVEITREALRAAKAELAGEKAQHDPWPQRIDAAALAVLHTELAGPAVALAARMERMQRELFEMGTTLSWAANLGIIPEDAAIHRFEGCTAGGWGPRSGYTSASSSPLFTRQTEQALEAWFEALKRDAAALRPVELS